jgi:formylglycine-generating enzyme required for sulfatase activity
MFHNVRIAVIEKTGGEQVPWMEDGIQRRQRVKFGGESKPTAPAQPQVSEAERTWPWVKETASQAVLENFIKQFGDTPFGAMARARLEELKKQQLAVAVPPKAPAPVRQKPPQPAVAVTPSPPPAPCDGVEIAVGIDNERRCLKPGAGKSEQFKDCPSCPEMVVVPAGRFTMGSPANEPERFEKEEDQVSVIIAKPFAVGRFAVTLGEFAGFVEAINHKPDGGCYGYTSSGDWKLQVDRDWRTPGISQTDRHPVVCVNWNDANAYVAWLTLTTGKSYRLLSETEREYMARAGTSTPFWWGATISTSQANYNGTYTYAGGSKGEWRKATVAVDAFAANPWGLYNVHGNVWEWTEDCWNEKNAGNPGIGSARTIGDCRSRILRGGSWDDGPKGLRSAYRIRLNPARLIYTGFRVARTLN